MYPGEPFDTSVDIEEIHSRQRTGDNPGITSDLREINKCFVLPFIFHAFCALSPGLLDLQPSHVRADSETNFPSCLARVDRRSFQKDDPNVAVSP
jgi:hypothetical protein